MAKWPTSTDRHLLAGQGARQAGFHAVVDNNVRTNEPLSAKCHSCEISGLDVDHSGKLATSGDFCPVDLTLAKGAPIMITAAPGKEHRACCNVILSVLFDRRTDRIPYSKLELDRIHPV